MSILTAQVEPRSREKLKENKEFAASGTAALVIFARHGGKQGAFVFPSCYHPAH
jgi:hypothetical protein